MRIHQPIILAALGMGLCGCQSWGCPCGTNAAAPTPPTPVQPYASQRREPDFGNTRGMATTDSDPIARREPGAVVPPWDPKRPLPKR
jgi:hypothetical protein